MIVRQFSECGVEREVIQADSLSGRITLCNPKQGDASRVILGV